jgi:FkbM family methyltransferase
MMSLIDVDLALLRTAALFDLSTPEGRKESVTRLRGLFYRLHEITQPRTVFEIGAKEATFSRTIRKLLPRSRAIAFEANPFVFAKEKKASDPKLDGVDYRNLAVAAHTGTTTFHVQTRRGEKLVKPTLGSNSLMNRLGDVETVEVEVPCVRLADFIAGETMKRPLSAWIDVEGAIGLVLPGLESELDDFLMIFCEVEDLAVWEGQWTWEKVHAFLSERGFRAVARDFERPGQNNVLFVQDRVLRRADARGALSEYYSGVAWPFEEVVVDNSWRPSEDKRAAS